MCGDETEEKTEKERVHVEHVNRHERTKATECKHT